MDIKSNSMQAAGPLEWQGQADAAKLHQLQQSAQSGEKDHAKLKKAAQEFEAIFVQQLLDAMDKTIDRKDGLLNGGSAEQYFRGMMNQEIAKSMTQGPGGSGFGLAESIYKQMARQLPQELPQDAPPAAAAAPLQSPPLKF